MTRLEDSRFCRHLPEECIATVSEQGVPRSFPEGSMLFREGDVGDGLYIILHGSVDITAKSAPDREHVLSRMEAGDYFGEMAIFDGGTRSASASARTDVHAVFLPAGLLLELLAKAPRLATSLVRDASLRMRDFNRRFLRESLRAERLAMLERLARTIVHDFRNPLNVIGIAADMAAEPTATAADRRSSRDRIRYQVEVLNRMMQELMDFTRGMGPNVVLARVNYRDFLREVLIELSAESQRRGVDVEVTGHLPSVELRIDPPRLSRVFTNLTQNAFDALSGKKEGKLSLSVRQEGEMVVTEILDNGPGIPTEHLPMLFEPFFTAGKAHGTGLGLAICERIIREHGGRIWAESNPGVGAAFRFELPIAAHGDTERLTRNA
jgi:signal transduction histidine kinase